MLASIQSYVLSHFSGQHSLARSFFLNFVALYIALVLGLVWLQPPIIPGMIVYGLGMIWAVVGCARSAINVWKSDVTLVRKNLAGLALIAMIMFVLLSVKDLLMLLGG